jgi:hypothetical protein
MRACWLCTASDFRVKPPPLPLLWAAAVATGLKAAAKPTTLTSSAWCIHPCTRSIKRS